VSGGRTSGRSPPLAGTCNGCGTGWRARASRTWRSKRRGVLEAAVARTRRNVELLLVNAKHVKMIPGRKTDMAGAAWLAQLLE
jgi:hypothetical protein